jgi:undecaprenyl-diphosphatase
MELLKMIESIRSPILDVIIGFITRLGEEELIIVVICIAYWCINKMFAYKTGTIFFLSGLTVQCAKIAFRIPRPWVLDSSFNPVESAKIRASGYSFPSGHTQSGSALFGSLGAQFKQVYLKIIFFVIIFLIGFSRMYLGVHTLKDVATSIILTLVVVFLTYKFFKGDMRNKKRLLALSLFIILYAVSGIVYAFVLYSNALIEQNFVVDYLKAAGAAVGFAVAMYIENVYIRFSVKTKNIGMQALKVLFGVIGVFLFLEGLKFIIGTSMVADTIRYFLSILWIMAIYPIIIKRLFSVPESAQTHTGKSV